MMAVWLRTGTGFLCRAWGEGEALRTVKESLKGFLQGQAGKGCLEWLRLQEKEDGLHIVCIPKAGAREILPRGERLMRRLQRHWGFCLCAMEGEWKAESTR